jgi:hypothetical protein
MDEIRSRLTYANVMATLAVFIAIGGSAFAAVIVASNDQVAQDTISGHKPPAGAHSNIIAASVNGQDVANNSLTGADIATRSGVDTCKTPLTAQFGPICAGSDGGIRTWNAATDYCSGYGLRLPSVGEGQTLAQNYSVPGVAPNEYFWTDAAFESPPDFRAMMLYGNGIIAGAGLVTGAKDTAKTVCVTDPSA